MSIMSSNDSGLVQNLKIIRRRNMNMFVSSSLRNKFEDLVEQITHKTPLLLLNIGY